MMDEVVYSALSHISPEEREVWVRVGMALRSEYGDAAFDAWDDWSAQSERYRSSDARSAWRSFNGHGIGIGSLYFLAGENGWRRDTQKITRTPRRVPRVQSDPSQHHEARRIAQERLDLSVLGTHPYLASKGFPEHRGLVYEGDLLIPMRGCRGALNSIQTIRPDGAKRFLKGGKASGSVFAMGSGLETYLCEGFATALSIRAAMAALYRRARVVVCFTASNLTKVPGTFVIADNDSSGTGRRYAEKTGLPWWMPPDTDMDANDFHRSEGIRALADALRCLRASS